MLRTAAFPVRIRIGSFFMMLTFAIAIGLIGFFYLAKFTDVHTKGYQLRKLEIERERLMSHREHKSVDIAREKALVSVRAAAIDLSMIPAKKISYVKEDSAVAQSSPIVLGQFN